MINLFDDSQNTREEYLGQKWLTYTYDDIQVTGKLEAMTATFTAPFLITIITLADTVYALFGKENSYTGGNN